MQQMSWQTYSVQKFFSGYNWQKCQFNLDQILSSQEVVKHSWQEQTVKFFFGNSNWDGHLLSNKNSHQRKPDFSIRLPVQEFLSFLIWEGCPKIASLPRKKMDISHAEDEVNLTHFSNLF